MKEKIIKKGYLTSLVLYAVLISAAGIAVSSVLLHIDIYRPLDTHYGAILAIITEIKNTLLIRTLKINGIFSLLILAGLVALAIFYTHRIAGPLYRIKVSARAIGEGQLQTRIKFRRKDAIHPFAESLNAMTESYRDRVKSLKSEIQQLKDTVAEIKSLTEEGKDTEAQLKKALEADSKIKGILYKIKL